MFNGSGDFSALNMQGDMSHRNSTKSGRVYPNTDAGAGTTNHITMVYAILALFILGIVIDAIRELMIIVIIFSFMVDRLVAYTGKTIFLV